MNVGTGLDSSPGVVVKIFTFIMGCRLGAGTVVALPFTLPASCCWDILGYGWGVDPFAPFCPLGLGSGGERDLWPPGKRATSQATTLPASTLWRRRSEYSISLPSRSKHELSQPCFCLRATQGSNSGLPHCRRTLYHRSHQGSPSLRADMYCFF